MKLTVEKLPVVLGALIGLSKLLEGLATGDWLYRAVPFALVRGAAAYCGGRFGLFVFAWFGWKAKNRCRGLREGKWIYREGRE